MPHIRPVTLALLLALVAGGAGGAACAGGMRGTSDAPEAAAEIRDAHGDAVAAAVLTQLDAGVGVAIRGQSLPPGEHGFHVHETGRCDPPGFQSAGGHFNPAGRQHGTLNPQGAHAGDMPNLRVRDDGTVDTTLVITGLAITGGDRAVLREGGTALVIHALPDDYRTDPSGNSGDRIACGVVIGR